MGDSSLASRMGAPGATMRTTPTDVRSHPIVPALIVDTARA